jgi:hypothetical protein
VSGDVWLAASVVFAPVQVFADDQRLTPSTAPPASLPARSFTFVAGSGLYVNAGGGNPGTHRTQVGRRVRGIFASGKSYIVIRGFTVTRCEDRNIQLRNSSDILVEGNTLTFSGGFGFQADGDSADRVVSNRSFNNGGHGFSFINRTVETTIEGNEAFDNADPDIRVANGIFVGGSTRNVIRRNRWHHNQDSGEQFSTTWRSGTSRTGSRSRAAPPARACSTSSRSRTASPRTSTTCGWTRNPPRGSSPTTTCCGTPGRSRR